MVEQQESQPVEADAEQSRSRAAQRAFDHYRQDSDTGQSVNHAARDSGAG
jgi:hypothetical protein